MFSKEIGRGIGGILRHSAWIHSGLLGGHPAFQVIAMRASRDHIVPYCFSPKMAWNDMINGEIAGLAAAILTGEIIPAEDFFTVEFDDGSWTFDHPLQPDH